MSSPPGGPRRPDEVLPPDFEPEWPDDLVVRRCYRHPDRETGVSCSSCGRPICHECMIPAPVGFHCPECVRGRGATPRPRVVTRAQMRSRWAGSGLAATAPVTRLLIGINVVVFLLELVLGAVSPLGGTGRVLVDMGALVPGYVAGGQYWRLLTAMFLHGGLFHILFNMYALYLGGSFLEYLAGRGRYLAIYLLSGLAGNVAVYLLASPWSVTIGASTAIFGVFGALFVYSLRHRGSPAGRALQSMGTVILINLVITFLVPGISWQGHVGGLLGGMAAMEALTARGRLGLSGPFGSREVAAVATLLAVLAALVALRTAAGV